MPLEKVPILRYLEHDLRSGKAQYASTLLHLMALRLMLLAIPPGVCGAVPPPLLGRFRAGWQIEALY